MAEVATRLFMLQAPNTMEVMAGDTEVAGKELWRTFLQLERNESNLIYFLYDIFVKRVMQVKKKDRDTFYLYINKDIIRRRWQPDLSDVIIEQVIK